MNSVSVSENKKVNLTKQQLAALDYGKHIALTANAGSGKTFVFAKRFVKIALEKNPELDKIVAITFTEKAAGELYARIAKEIEKQAEEGGDREKLNKMRKRLVSAKISTIHSFCFSLLRDYSPQAGLDANVSIIKDNERENIINKAFDDIFEAELASSELRALLRFFGSKKMLRSTIKEAIDKRRILNKLFKEIYAKDKTEIKAELERKSETLYKKIILPQLKKIAEDVREINDEIKSIKPTPATAEVDNLISLIENDSIDEIERMNVFKQLRDLILTKSGTLRKGYSSQISDFERVNKRLSRAFDLLKDFKFKSLNDNLDALTELSVNFFAFYNKISDEYERMKYQNGLVDFEDILLKANELLEIPEVLADVQAKFEYVMVDEFQDTNELQYDIIMPLLDKLNRGNLFVVGDEKQSIYMFNNAELEVFEATKTEVEQHSGEILELPHSFRLAKNNALFTNFIFKRIFNEPEKVFNEVEFNKLIVSSKDKEDGRVEFILTREDEENSPTEAEILANKIKRLLSSGEIEAGETAVLTRQNKHVSEIEKALAKEKIPYIVLSGVGYFQELVIRDIQNYLMFLSSPNNDLALVSILRAPFYALSDAEIFKISLESGAESFWEKLKAYSELNDGAKPVIQKLEKHIEYAAAYEIPTLINKVLTETDYWAVLAAKENVEQEIANLKKLIFTSLETLSGEATTLYEYAERLRASIKEFENEGAASVGNEAEAVTVMTFHKSKGLEFDTVFLYKTNAPMKTESVKSKEIKFDKHFGLLSKTPSPDGYFYEYVHNPLSWIYQYYTRRKHAAEAKRLLYVGVTRAKKNLFISAALSKNGTVRKNSFFEMIKDALDFDIDDASVTITDKLEFGKGEPEIITYEINIETNVYENIDYSQGEKAEKKFETDFNVIKSSEHNEFISATKIALYKFCPFKYKLTYELGYGRLFNLLKNVDWLEFNNRENIDENVPANLLGSVLHKALELEIEKNNFETVIEKAAEEIAGSTDERNAVKNEAKSILQNFVESQIFSWLKSKKNFKNEYEIYLRLEDYFLYGIIDKLIFDDGKIIVVDYKSDKVTDGNFEKKFSHYENQLKFYLFILSKFYEDVNEFEARLVFFRYPEKSIFKNYGKEEISAFGNELNEIVAKIRKGEFLKNTESCASCVYYSNGNCVA